MKRIVVMMAFCVAIAGCNSADNKGTDEKKSDSGTAAANNATTAEHEKGLEMIAADNCLTCHRPNEKNIGPSYVEVAKKYEATDANIDSLAIKIIKGGQGVWGQIPMTPHPALSMDSARQMVKAILAMKN